MWGHAYLATNEMYRTDMDVALSEAKRASDLAVEENDLIGLGYAVYLQISAEAWLLNSTDELSEEKANELLTRLTPVSEGVRSVGERNMIGHVLQSEAILSASLGDNRKAADAFDESIAALTELRTVGCVCHCLEAIASYVARAGLHGPAVRLIGASDQLRTDIGIRVAPVETHFRGEALTEANSALTAEEIEAELEVGRLFGLAEAAQFARQTLTDM
jgi:hypothetical protein